jgi:hypothetical protein
MTMPAVPIVVALVWALPVPGVLVAGVVIGAVVEGLLPRIMLRRSTWFVHPGAPRPNRIMPVENDVLA